MSSQDDNFPGTSGPRHPAGQPIEELWSFDSVPTPKLRQELTQQIGHLRRLNRNFSARKGSRVQPAVRQRKQDVEQLIDLIKLELIKREALAKPAQRLEGRGRKSDAAVAKRRALIKTNPHATSPDLCRLFDRENIRLPEGAVWDGVSDWSQAYRQNPDLRRKIQTIISQDRRRR